MWSPSQVLNGIDLWSRYAIALSPKLLQFPTVKDFRALLIKLARLTCSHATRSHSLQNCWNFQQ
ncbi:MAG: hypothetical protein F6K56_30625 [Moorea sp. SIO3G5]|nr:hypothetical protein [Moorena sp. SIO3G5]